MLQVKDIQKTYGTTTTYQALKGISFAIEKGAFVGIMGPSGSGKSTLLNAIATIDQPTTGTITLNGQNPYQLNEEQIAKFRRTELGFVFQSFNLLPTLTVAENILLPMSFNNVSIKKMKQATKDIANRLGIESLLNKKIAEISGGQAQRVAVARAMVHQPQLVLADEPTGNLDTKASKDVMQLLKQLNQEEQATVLMVTHDALAASYCQRILFIKDGQLVAEVTRTGKQKEYYQTILKVLARIEGVENEF